MPNNNKAFRYTAITLRILERILDINFNITGDDNLPDKPVMFVCNHFTRSETFFVPYLIYKKTNRQVRCLADSSLYNGILGKFLNSVGTISTKNFDRDNIILRDLITASNDWMIYPEGSMIKSKEITKDGKNINNIPNFISHTPNRIGSIRTGSAVIALKSEIYRSDIINAKINQKSEILNFFNNNLGLKIKDIGSDLGNFNTNIVPLTISYYPIRPGNNPIKDFTLKLIKKIPPSIAEELEIEGNLLMNSEINLHFGKAINIAEYIKSARNLIYQIPIIKNDTKANFIIKYAKNKLTNQLMFDIYQNLQINFDHIFTAIIKHYPDNKISITKLKNIIYLASNKIVKSKKYRYHQHLEEKNLFTIFSCKQYQPLDSVFELAISQNIIAISDDNNHIIINNENLNKNSDFHQIRLENTLQVIVNEFLLLDFANLIVKKLCNQSDDDLAKNCSSEILYHDRQKYEEDYKKYFDIEFSKNIDIGYPTLLKSENSLYNQTGIVICHGYKSSPNEVIDLAKFLHNIGYNIYITRLDGHSTSPINIKYSSNEDWIKSFERGYSCLQNISKNIITIGFSTGGLISLLLSQKNYSKYNIINNCHKLTANITINAALQLKDIRTRLVPGINLWNELLDKFNISAGKFEYIDDEPENPDINYSRNYLKGVNELAKLIEKTKAILGEINIPTLVIQSRNDPVVNPNSGNIIFDKIASDKKEIFTPDIARHTIITGEDKFLVFEKIADFIKKYE